MPIKTVASFKRMREFQPKGLPWVVDALRTSEELEVDEKGENVRRRTEVQPPKGQFERSVYAVRVSPFFLWNVQGRFTGRDFAAAAVRAERVREGGARPAEEDRRILQPIREDERGEDEEGGWHERVQGACLVISIP